MVKQVNDIIPHLLQYTYYSKLLMNTFFSS